MGRHVQCLPLAVWVAEICHLCTEACFFCLDCVDVMFEAVIVYFSFSQGNTLRWGFEWVTVCIRHSTMPMLKIISRLKGSSMCSIFCNS